MTFATADLAAAGAIPPVMFTKNFAGANSAGRLASLWGVAQGTPPQGAYDTTLNGVTLSGATTGALWRNNPPSGTAHLYALTVNQGASVATLGASGMLWVIDRLWHNGGFTITSTSGQSITSPTWPSRCPTSHTDATPTTTGHGVYLGVEVSATTGSGTPTLTVAYTNSAGTASRTGVNVVDTIATSAANTFYPIGLQSGDVGVRSVQSLTLSASWTSGTINMVAYRILGVVALPAPGVTAQRFDWYALGGGQIYDDSCLSFLYGPGGTSNLSVSLSGFFQEAQG